MTEVEYNMKNYIHTNLSSHKIGNVMVMANRSKTW